MKSSCCGRKAEFSAAAIADLHSSYELSDLKQGDFSVVKALKKEFKVMRPEQIRTLSDRVWTEMVQRYYAAGEPNIPITLSEAAGVRVPEATVYREHWRSSSVMRFRLCLCRRSGARIEQWRGQGYAQRRITGSPDRAPS